MCCTTTPNALTRNPFSLAEGHLFQNQCECGCLGNQTTALGLDRYREHLKAELKHVESRISQLKDDDQ